MRKYLPILSWTKDYDRATLVDDTMAGITVGVMLIPQGMAYAMLAGLPPIYGLYASTIPLIIYAILGTSRQLAIGPVAMVSLLVASGVGAICELGSVQFINYAILLALMVGVIQFIMGALRLGFLVNLISHPVIVGFTSAAALIIGFSQLGHLLGLELGKGKIHETILSVADGFSDINIPTLIIGLSSIALIVIFKKINGKIPMPLIIVFLAIGIVHFFRLDSTGVQIIKDVPAGLPNISTPFVTVEALTELLPIAIAISLISYMESYAVAKSIQSKHKNYDIESNQELIGLGMANIVGSFFSAFPVTGGFSRTAVNDQAGAKSGMAAIVSAILVMLTLLFLTSYFYYLPKAALAAIILVAVLGLIDYREARHLWITDKQDFLAFVVTFLATIFISIETGLLVGVAVSVMFIIYRLSNPHIAELGQIPNSNTYRNLARFDELDTVQEALILRFDAPLFFANSSSFKETILSRINERSGLKRLIIDGGGIHHVDTSAINMLLELSEKLHQMNISLQFADIKGPVRDLFHRNGLVKVIGEQNFFLHVSDAMDSSSSDLAGKLDRYLFQNN